MNIEDILKAHGKKITPERIKLYAWMKKRHLFHASDIEKDFAHIGRASIFRNLKLFVELGILRRIHLGTGAESYEIECCKEHHHEHMKCTQCGDILSFESANICKKLFSEAKKLGFQISEHSIGIFGTCKNCI